MDPLLGTALQLCDLRRENIELTELYIWTDPGWVSYREGERGEIHTLYPKQNEGE